MTKGELRRQEDDLSLCSSSLLSTMFSL